MLKDRGLKHCTGCKSIIQVKDNYCPYCRFLTPDSFFHSISYCIRIFFNPSWTYVAALGINFLYFATATGVECISTIKSGNANFTNSF